MRGTRHVLHDNWRQTSVGHAMITVERLRVESLNEVWPFVDCRGSLRK